MSVPVSTRRIGAREDGDPRASGSREQGGGLPREPLFRLSNGCSALLRERLDTFVVAFLNDPRPGLLFEYGRLVFANDAARRLLRSTEVDDDFLNDLRLSLKKGEIEHGLLLRSRSGVYAPVLHPARSLKGHSTRICFLVRRSEASAAFSMLSERELEVLRRLVRGFTNGEIAAELCISIETVRKHVSHALEKTGTKTRAGLVGRALGR